jgi:hypothetical protein
MLRKLTIAIAAVSAIALGTTVGASAMHGGHFGFHGFHQGFAFHHHRFFHHGFFFAGAPYAYDDDCYARVWTRWGWRWRPVCY